MTQPTDAGPVHDVLLWRSAQAVLHHHRAELTTEVAALRALPPTWPCQPYQLARDAQELARQPKAPTW